MTMSDTGIPVALVLLTWITFSPMISSSHIDKFTRTSGQRLHLCISHPLLAKRSGELSRVPITEANEE